jgi:alcohol dehydrogenase class IV
MSKEELKNVENVNEVVVSGDENVKANDTETVDNSSAAQETVDVQPEPKTTDYNVRLRLTDQFIHDLIICLGEAAYVQSAGFINFAQQHKDDISIADLNEYIKKLETLPWKFVHQLLQNIMTENGRDAYFVIKNDNKTDE